VTDTDTTPVDVHTWIMRAIGASREDAERVVSRVEAETIAGMQQTPTHDLAAVFGDDQVHAAVQRVSASVAQHYATLRQTGMPDKRAAQLCAAMQEQWLAGVLPWNEHEVALLHGEGEG
jgi:hypothetical protein